MSVYPGPLNTTDPRAARIAVLMNTYLVRMQSSALKHVYLTSIVNALTHPQVRERKPHTDLVYTVGFGDRARTLPLALIQEASPHRSIRHAFVPDMGDPYERSLVDKLQHAEVVWARYNKVKPRNIKRQLQDYTRDEVCHRGINRYDPLPDTWDDPTVTHERLWLSTRYLPEALAIHHHGRPSMSPDGDDYHALIENIRHSLNSQWVNNDMGLEITSLDVQRTKPDNTMMVTRAFVKPDTINYDSVLDVGDDFSL